MEIKKTILIITAFFLLICHALCAQQAGYFVDYSDGNPRFVQRLLWDSEEYVLYYEVLILVDDNGYREYLKETTEDNLLLVSLPPGKYRYSVTPYDLLEIRGETSEWKEFEILPAFQPVIESFSPAAFYLDKHQDRVLYITGTNLFKESEFYLQGITGLIYPDKATVSNDRRVSLVFDDWKLIPGNYDVFVMNPGGLSTFLGDFLVGYRKPLDFFLKLSYAPVIPVYGYLESLMGMDVFPVGLSFSFQAISSKRGNFNGGLELAASVFFMNYEEPSQFGVDDLTVNFLNFGTGVLFTSFDLNFAFQRRFLKGRTAFTFRFGLGAVFVKGLEEYEKNSITMQLNLGADFIFRIYKNFNLEAGVDLNNHFAPFFSGILKPKLGVVLQF